MGVDLLHFVVLVVGLVALVVIGLVFLLLCFVGGFGFVCW